MRTVRTLAVMSHRRSARRLLVVKPADRDGTVEVLNADGTRAEMSESALVRDYEPYVASGAPDRRERLSPRARQILWLTAAHVADVCAIGMEPTSARTLAGVAGMSLAQLTPTLNGLLAKGLLNMWRLNSAEVRYVPSVAGVLYLGPDTPTTEQMSAEPNRLTPAS